MKRDWIDDEQGPAVPLQDEPRRKPPLPAWARALLVAVIASGVALVIAGALSGCDHAMEAKSSDADLMSIVGETADPGCIDNGMADRPLARCTPEALKNMNLRQADYLMGYATAYAEGSLREKADICIIFARAGWKTDADCKALAGAIAERKKALAVAGAVSH